MKIDFIKVTVIVLLVALVLLSCTNGSRDTWAYLEEEKFDQIAIISFIDVATGENQYISVVGEGDYEVIQTLQKEDFIPFLTELESLETHDYWNDPTQVFCGYNVLITFTDGRCHIINDMSTAYYPFGLGNSSGHIDFERHYYDRDEFRTLWNKYTEFDYSVGDMWLDN